MGSITHIVDDKEILNEYEYDVWGNVVSKKETVNNRFKLKWTIVRNKRKLG